MSKENPLIAIIGGTGKTGGQFAGFFERAGYKVLRVGRKTVPGIDEAASKADIVIVSVPISNAVEVIERISSIVGKDSVVMDFTSIKGPACRALGKCVGESIGMHPMFGPSVESLEGQTVVLCPVRGEKWLSWVKRFLEENKAKVIVCSASEHDKMMALVQVLTHFHSMVLAKTIQELGLDLAKSMEFATPLYRMKMATLRIMGQDPWLYSGIMFGNEESGKTVNSFVNAAKKLEGIIAGKDSRAFEEYFLEAGKYLGAYNDLFSDESDKLTKALYEKK